MDMNNYLQRIGVDEIEGANLETLYQLQMQHMLHVPFENLDVMKGVPIPLDVERSYEKVVRHQRGGFCYELNGLFNHLLRHLGFKSYFVSATVKRPDGTWAKEGTHAAQIVELDQPYLVDVGFGDSARVPLPLTGETRKDISGVYRVLKIKEGMFDLQRETNKEWNTIYRFDSTPKKLIDFEEVCHFNQTSPMSPFTQADIVSLATKDGRYTLSGNTFTITQQGEKKKMTIKDNDKLSILEQYFHIHLDQTV